MRRLFLAYDGGECGSRPIPWSREAERNAPVISIALDFLHAEVGYALLIEHVPCVLLGKTDSLFDIHRAAPCYSGFSLPAGARLSQEVHHR